MSVKFVKLGEEPLDINFQDAEDADPDLGEDTRNAIENMDFEGAAKISGNISLSKSNFLRSSSMQFTLERDQDINQIRELSFRKSQSIQAKSEEIVNQILTKYQKKFLELEKIHREEALTLKNRWIAHHQQAERIATKKIEDLRHTSKVLASCECYDAAINLRDTTTENEEQILNDEIRPGDYLFESQFRTMLDRHKEQYQSLHDQMESEMDIIRGDAEVEDVKVRSEAAYQEALSPVKMMQKISTSEELSTLDKKSIIVTLSPGRLSEVSSRNQSRNHSRPNSNTPSRIRSRSQSQEIDIPIPETKEA